MRKVYGSYRTESCPFCQKQATAKNEQGVAVCTAHKSSSLENLKCICGGWLDIKSGKFGAYGNCLKCGNVPLYKALRNDPHIVAPRSEEQMSPPRDNVAQRAPTVPRKPKEIIIRSDELDFI